MKLCTKCDKQKDYSEFYKSKRTKCGYRERCKNCENKYNKSQAEKRKDSNYVKRLKKYFNESYFENIDSEDKAYFLGFIYADGCIRYDEKRSIYNTLIKIHSKDEHILHSLIECVDGDLKIIKVKNRDIVQLSLTGKKLSKDLINIGLHQNKTFTLKYPEINPELERHFLRGYFDGDGCIRIKTDKRDGSQIGDMRFVGGSVEMLNGINERMNFLFGTKKNSLYGPKDKNYRFLGWGSMTDIEKIYKGFYEDSNFFLHRKKETFDNVINIIKDKKKYRKII